ncbi:MAG TPA: hypothetical protein PLO61_07960 [Fimbriimonadaceae bacterium]|nr:hypothetical protein [Fimbriimonadaceae bacterium]HRJ33404.1 hypothetical protein [Fimbriimonadaceae bacterium]
MNRCFLWLPDLLGSPESLSWLREAGGFPAPLLERAEVVRIEPLDPATISLLSLWGLPPEAHPMASGPLAVASLGQRPPEDSVHFQLDAMTLDPETQTIRPLVGAVTADEHDALSRLADRLQTRQLVPLLSRDALSALVWLEGSTELRTVPPNSAEPLNYAESLPDGDGEKLLRRFIDDSANLLLDHEVNQRRLDEDRPAISLFWPWGPGRRPQLPFVPIRRGEPAAVFSDHPHGLALASLTGDRPVRTSAWGRALEIQLEQLFTEIASHPLSLVLTHRFQRLRQARRDEEGVWMVHQILSRFLSNPRFADPGDFLQCGVILPRTDGPGLAFLTHPKPLPSALRELDERWLDEKSLKRYNAWEWALEHIG